MKMHPLIKYCQDELKDHDHYFNSDRNLLFILEPSLILILDQPNEREIINYDASNGNMICVRRINEPVKSLVAPNIALGSTNERCIGLNPFLLTMSLRNLNCI